MKRNQVKIYVVTFTEKTTQSNQICQDPTGLWAKNMLEKINKGKKL